MGCEFLIVLGDGVFYVCVVCFEKESLYLKFYFEYVEVCVSCLSEVSLFVLKVCILGLDINLE